MEKTIEHYSLSFELWRVLAIAMEITAVILLYKGYKFLSKYFKGERK